MNLQKKLLFYFSVVAATKNIFVDQTLSPRSPETKKAQLNLVGLCHFRVAEKV
jgi:hypothetical protein